VGPEPLYWSGPERVATFARLPAGDYRLEVGAADTSGRALPAGTAIALFTIRASWWETPLFRGVALGAGIAGLIWLVRRLVLLRVRSRMRRLEQERALERERARIARDMHDQLGASLTQIAITTKLLTLDPPERVAAHTRDIAAIARRTVESLDEIVWAVDPANDSLAAALDYLGQFALNFLGTAGIECELVLPENPPALPLPSRTRHHVFLAVKEALNNIVKHAGATRVGVKFHARETEAVLQVEDNGRGLGETPAPAGADGLRNMQARMQEIGGGCRIENAPGSGTRITFTWALSAVPAEATS
jgi:signal transduction histidine kinase